MIYGEISFIHPGGVGSIVLQNGEHNYCVLNVCLNALKLEIGKYVSSSGMQTLQTEWMSADH